MKVKSQKLSFIKGQCRAALRFCRIYERYGRNWKMPYFFKAARPHCQKVEKLHRHRWFAVRRAARKRRAAKKLKRSVVRKAVKKVKKMAKKMKRHSKHWLKRAAKHWKNAKKRLKAKAKAQGKTLRVQHTYSMKDAKAEKKKKEAKKKKKKAAEMDFVETSMFNF